MPVTPLKGQLAVLLIRCRLVGRVSKKRTGGENLDELEESTRKTSKLNQMLCGNQVLLPGLGFGAVTAIQEVRGICEIF
jgi:hypothetical protein